MWEIEVPHYIQALKAGFGVVKNSGLITLRTIQMIQEELEHNRAGFRKLPGTESKYVPMAIGNRGFSIFLRLSRLLPG